MQGRARGRSSHVSARAVCTILQYISDDDAALCCEGLGSDSDQGFDRADGSHHTHRDHVANISETSSKGNGQYDGSHPSNIAWIGIDHNNPCYAVGRDALCPELWGAYTRYQLFHNMGLPLEDSGYNGAWIKMASNGNYNQETGPRMVDHGRSKFCKRSSFLHRAPVLWCYNRASHTCMEDLLFYHVNGASSRRDKHNVRIKRYCDQVCVRCTPSLCKAKSRYRKPSNANHTEEY